MPRHTVSIVSLSIVALLSLNASAASPFVYLTDISYIVGGVWDGKTLKDQMVAGTEGNTSLVPIRVRGVTYSKGIWGNLFWDANQVIAVDTRNTYSRFTAIIGITDAISPSACEWCYDSLNVDKYACVWRPPCYNQAGCEEKNRFVCVGAGARVKILGLRYTPRDTVEYLRETQFYRYTPNAISVDISGLQNIDRLFIIFDPRHVEQLNAPYRRGLESPVDVGRNSFFDHVAIADAKLYKVTTGVQIEPPHALTARSSPARLQTASREVRVASGGHGYTILGQRVAAGSR